MPDAGGALREASDTLLRDLEALSELEEIKRGIEPGDPRLIELAGTIEAMAERVLASSSRQRELTIEANDLVDLDLPGAPKRPIDETPRAIQTILADWREAERRAQSAVPGSTEAAEAKRAIDTLKAEYRRAHEEASGHSDA
jgi:hypothetical protein